MANTPNTMIWLIDGREINVEMSAEDLKTELRGAGPLSKLPAGDGKFIYLNPVHIVSARDTTDDKALTG